MNDERQFLPLYRENQYRSGEYDIAIVNKSVIAMIEEEESKSGEAPIWDLTAIARSFGGWHQQHLEVTRFHYSVKRTAFY